MLGIGHILTNTPFFVLACALLWKQRRFSPLLTGFVFSAFVFAHGLSDFLLGGYYSGDVWWLPIQFISFVFFTLVLFFVMFRVKFARVLYCFLFLRAIYTAVLYVVLNCFRLALPGKYIGFDETPLYTLAAVLVITVMLPFLWRYFTGRLRDAFTVLSDATIRQLCVPPVLFFALDQFYSVMRDTLKYDNLQTAAIFVFMLLTGLATYYVNLRMVMDNALQSRLAMEAKIKEQALAADNLALDRLNRMKSDLIATVSHETMTPLAVLSGYAELVAMELREKGVDEQTTRDLDNIAEETQRISWLMDELRNHARGENERLSKDKINLSKLTLGVARLYTPIMARRGNTLTLRLPDDLPDVYASPGEVTQVLFNVLQNCRNHTETGAVTITAATENDFVAVVVADTGSGIPSELLPRVFERGVSGGEGNGLGLSICKEIIENHGGEITVDSEHGKGTSVRFTLPVWKDGMGDGV